MGTRRQALALVAGLGMAAVGLAALAWPRLPIYPDSDELVILWNRLQSYEISRLWVSEPEYADYRKQSRSFQALGAYSVTSYELSGPRQPERLAGRKVTASLFPLLGIAPQLGRTILPEEDLPGAEPVAVISHSLWQRHFGGDPQVVGGTLRLDQQRYTVVGVMPEGFEFPSPEVQLWTPLALDEQHPGQRQAHYLTVLGRLQPDLEVEAAQAEMSAIVRELSEQHYRNAGWQVVLEPLHEGYAARQGTDPGLQPLESLAFETELRIRQRQESADVLDRTWPQGPPRRLPYTGNRGRAPRISV